jgi:PAS domain S-box-containing protein
MGTIWLLGGIAAVAILLAVWALAGARRATRARDRLVEAIADLGAGALDRRLEEEDVGTAAAATFNQTARDLDLLHDESRRSLERLRELAVAIPGQVLLALNAEDEVEEILGDLEGLTGHHPALVAGRHASFFFPDESDWEQLCTQAGEGEQDTAHEVAVRRSDGVLVPGVARTQQLPGGRRHLCLMAVAAVDDPVTEQAGDPAPSGDEAAAQEMNMEGTRFAAFAGALPDGMALVEKGILVSASPRFLSMVGDDQDDQEIIGRPLVELVLPSDAVTAASLVEGDARQGAGAVELRFRRAHGQVAVLSVTVGQMEVEERRLFLLSVRDVSLSHGRHRRLENSAAWLSAALQASADGLAVLPLGGGRPAVANDRFLEFLGLTAERIPAVEQLSTLIHDRFTDGAAVQAFLAGEPPAGGSQVTATFTTRGHPAQVLELTRLPVRDGRHQPQGTLLVLRDVSAERLAREGMLERLSTMERSASTVQDECRRLEVERRQLDAEAAQLLRENQELHERDEMKTNMLGNFTHEMQNPMVSIRGYNEMMLRGDLGEITGEQREGLEIALRNAKRLAALVDQLMIFARTEETLDELMLEAFPVWKLLEENISLLGDQVKGKNLQVTTRYTTDELMILADRNLISQVVSNVLGNAVKYSLEGGEVAITVRSAGADELVVEVRDTGVGIPGEEQGRIFQRGFRASTSGGTRGSGIGLALVQEILKRHGCEIKVESRPQEGSTFSFSLPLAPDDDPGDDGSRHGGDAGTPAG